MTTSSIVRKKNTQNIRVVQCVLAGVPVPPPKTNNASLQLCGSSCTCIHALQHRTFSLHTEACESRRDVPRVMHAQFLPSRIPTFFNTLLSTPSNLSFCCIHFDWTKTGSLFDICLIYALYTRKTFHYPLNPALATGRICTHCQKLQTHPSNHPGPCDGETHLSKTSKNQALS